MSPERFDVLAHEIRSPIAAIAAIAEAYAAADDERRRRLVDLAAAAVTSIERLLADASGAGARVDARVEAVDVGRLATEVAETAALGGVTVTVTAEAGLGLDADPDRLRQALVNLVANAIGHSPEGGIVRVEASRRGSSIVLSVSDEGDGIAADDVQRVFEPGIRLTSSRPGSGLGLAVVQAIVVAHGGEVLVESSPGRGSTFRLVLPGASGVG